MLSGKTLRDAMISGANNIAIERKLVDELNVFPVPDGDTGTNMSMTVQSGAKAIKQLSDNTTVAEVSKIMASSLLRGARGNSGVITSLLFRGFSKGLEDKREASGKDLAKALELGVEAAYKAVMNPTEGTILTVARVASEKASEAAKTEDDPIKIWDIITTEAAVALETTPDLLPVLKQAGVVDAGGRGLVVIFEGMKQVFDGGEIIPWEDTTSNVATAEYKHESSGRNAPGEVDADIKFSYCTEFIIVRKDDEDPIKLRAYFETIGDSVVVVDDDDIIKVHLHTNEPGNAIQRALTYGPLSKIKIDNMKEQHTSIVMEVQQTKESAEYVPVDPDIKYGFVAVAAGEGIKNAFLDLGCTKVVSGGQTMNPSTDDILEAVQSVPAKTVYVLPNNKNIIMAAEQVIELADREVIVLPTVSVPEGMSAMLVFNPDADSNENAVAMNEAAENVESGQITYAARNSDFEGHKIKEGEILAIANGKLAFVDTKLDKAAVKLTKTLAKKKNFVTIIYGEDVSAAEAEEMQKNVSSKLGSDVEVMLLDGGQPVYYYIISAE